MNVEVPDKEGEQLNPFKLQRNLIRLENFLQPFEENVHSLGSITRWENPVVSFMAFTIYMVIIYKDWLLPAIFLTIVSVFTFTYLRHKGRSFGDEIENIANYKEETAKDLSMRDQISILINVSRRSQGHAGLGSDILEKIRNVLLWREPELTKPVVLVCGMVFVCSLLFPFSFLVRTSGLGLGIHIFIIQYVFSRYPRLNRKYNKVEELISQLKTDAEYEMEIKKIKKNLKKSPKIARSESAIQSTSSLNTTSAMSSSSLNSLDCSEITTLASFHDTFQLPTSEIPLPTWKNGRRCILVNKEKYFAVGFKTGKMYVTNNYLLFERHKTVSSKNVVIHMETIKTITKAKLHQWVPGGGKAIEVKVKDSSKTLVFVFQVNIFGPIVNRDEAFDSIMEVGVTNDYLWAKTKESTQ
uniref:GRAM domain-containing protein n=1 Tax=Strigamia maritima TaxID=126957 RepID=T1J734_STRMM